MSVQERWAIAIAGPDHGLEVAARLAAASGASIRWAALWTARPLPDELRSQFGTALRVESGDGLEPMFFLDRPPLAALRLLFTHAANDRLVVRWTPRIYTSDEGPEGTWISFRDPDGFVRMDAKLYAIELTANAVPLTAGDRLDHPDLLFGPQNGSGWQLGFVAIRDHMSSEELRQWVATAAAVDRRLVDSVK